MKYVRTKNAKNAKIDVTNFKNQIKSLFAVIVHKLTLNLFACTVKEDTA